MRRGLFRRTGSGLCAETYRMIELRKAAPSGGPRTDELPPAGVKPGGQVVRAEDTSARVQHTGLAGVVLSTTVSVDGGVEHRAKGARDFDSRAANELDAWALGHAELALRDLLENPQLSDVEFTQRVRAHVETIWDRCSPVGERRTDITTKTLVERTNEAVKTVVQTARLTRTLQKKSVLGLQAKLGPFELKFGLTREVEDKDESHGLVLYLENEFGRFSAQRRGDWFVFVSKGTPVEGCEAEFERLREKMAAHRRGMPSMSLNELSKVISRLGEINKAMKYYREGTEVQAALHRELIARESITLPIDQYLLRVGADGLVERPKSA